MNSNNSNTNKKASKKPILTSLLSLIIFILIVIFMNSNFILSIDKSLNSFMPSIENSFLISISKAIGFVFDTISLVIISLILSIILWLKNYKKQALFFSITNLIAAAIIYLAKEIIHRVRPENILINETNSSFPSGHATIAVVFFGLLIYLAMKKKNEIRSSKLKIVTSIISVFMILIIGFSRLYLNAHWLSDIIAGYCLGLFVLTSAIIFREKIFSN